MLLFFFFFFKQKTAYEMRISDWSSDVCSSDLLEDADLLEVLEAAHAGGGLGVGLHVRRAVPVGARGRVLHVGVLGDPHDVLHPHLAPSRHDVHQLGEVGARSEEHTSELQPLMRISYAVFSLKKKTKEANTRR